MYDFTQPGEALDLYGNSIRESIKTDVYKNVYNFRVVVLTKPLPLSGNGLVVSGYKFMGRIMDPPIASGGPPSPHKLLPDPCRLDSSIDPSQISKIIRLHTEFSSGPGMTDMPNPGDEIEVTLQPGDYSYNVRHAVFTSMRVKNANRSEKNIASCDVGGSLSNLFVDGGSGLGSFEPRKYTYMGGDVSLKGSTVENGRIPESLIGTMNTTYSAHGAKVLKEHLVWWDGLAKAYYEKFKEKFPAQAGGGYRTFEKQGKMYVDPKLIKEDGKHLAAKPGTSNHGLGTAVDISSAIVQFSNDKYKWLFANALTHNIVHPCWAREPSGSSALAKSRCKGCVKCGSNVEVWHWEISYSLKNAVLKQIT